MYVDWCWAATVSVCWLVLIEDDANMRCSDCLSISIVVTLRFYAAAPLKQPIDLILPHRAITGQARQLKSHLRKPYFCPSCLPRSLLHCGLTDLKHAELLEARFQTNGKDPEYGELVSVLYLDASDTVPSGLANVNGYLAVALALPLRAELHQ